MIVKQKKIFTGCFLSLLQFCPALETPNLACTWPLRPPGWLPLVHGSCLHTASLAPQSLCWLFPCLVWQNPESTREESKGYFWEHLWRKKVKKIQLICYGAWNAMFSMLPSKAAWSHNRNMEPEIYDLLLKVLSACLLCWSIGFNDNWNSLT